MALRDQGIGLGTHVQLWVKYNELNTTTCTVHGNASLFPWMVRLL